MARVAINVHQLFGSRNPANPGADMAFTQADATNDHEWTLADGRDVLYAINFSGGALSFTVKAVADPTGRTEDVTVSIGAGSERALGPFRAVGWAQSDGKVQVDTAAASTLQFMVLRLPAN